MGRDTLCSSEVFCRKGILNYFIRVEYMPRGSSLNRDPEKEDAKERILEKIKDLKQEERIKIQGAQSKPQKLKEDDLAMAKVIQGVYKDLEERLARDSPSLLPKKKETLQTRKLRAQIEKRKSQAQRNAEAQKLTNYYRTNPTNYLKKKTYRQREAESEYYKEKARTMRELKEMSENPQAFEEKMKKKEEEELEATLSEAFGAYKTDEQGLPPPGHTRPMDEGYLELLDQPKPSVPSVPSVPSTVPAFIPFLDIRKAKSDPGRKKSKARSRSKRARSANQVSKRMPAWAKKKKARPAPVRSKTTHPKTSKFFTGRYS